MYGSSDKVRKMFSKFFIVQINVFENQYILLRLKQVREARNANYLPHSTEWKRSDDTEFFWKNRKGRF